MDFKDTLKILGKQAKQKRTEQQLIAQNNINAAKDCDFATVVGQVTPLKQNNQYIHPKDTSPIRVRPRHEEELPENLFYIGTTFDEEPPAAFVKNGRGENDLRKLRAKAWPIVATVDLHGYYQDEAQEILNEFIAYVQKRGVCGEIVHGSGLGSKDSVPVLKSLVRYWLIQHPEVLAYTEPSPHNDGAVLVLLRKKLVKSNK